MLRGLWFVMGVDLQVRFWKGQYVFVRLCNGVSVGLCITSPSQRCINNSLHVYVYVCVHDCMYVYLYVYGVYVCAFVYASMYVYVYVHLYICIYVCVYVFTCGWIYGVGVVQSKTRYLTWRLQYRLKLMAKETLKCQRAKIEIIEVRVMLLEIVTWHELQ